MTCAGSERNSVFTPIFRFLNEARAPAVRPRDLKHVDKTGAFLK